MKTTIFFDWNGNYCEAFVDIVKKSAINPLYDIHVASVEMCDDTYLEIYSVDGVLCGYYEKG